MYSFLVSAYLPHSPSSALHLHFSHSSPHPLLLLLPTSPILSIFALSVLVLA